MRVLIVEDEALIGMDLAMLVAELGHDVCAIAASAAAAITQAAAHNPDVVLMDIRLAQGSSGIDAARELHARQALRCIFLSANLDEPTRTALLPYDPDRSRWKARPADRAGKGAKQGAAGAVACLTMPPCNRLLENEALAGTLPGPGSRRSSRATVDKSVSFTSARSETVQRSISAFWLQAAPNSRL